MTTAISAKTTTCYEHPLNEQMRICLRMESLFTLLNKQLNAHNDQTYQALISLLTIINTIDRPDIKSKITQTLNQYALSLSQLERFNQIDNTRLTTVITKLDQLAHKMHQSSQQLTENFKQNHFLNQLRLQLSNPSGICSNSSSPLQLWQNQPKEMKLRYIHHWASHLSTLQASADMILGIIRQSKLEQEHEAVQGFFQKTLKPNLPCEMLIIKVDGGHTVYPEISAGKHRLSIRFMTPNFYHDGHSSQTQKNIRFKLTCCYF